jgi:hypothetical protein
VNQRPNRFSRPALSPASEPPKPGSDVANAQLRLLDLIVRKAAEAFRTRHLSQRREASSRSASLRDGGPR